MYLCCALSVVQHLITMSSGDEESIKQTDSDYLTDDINEGPFLRENVYFAAKEGQSLVLYTLLSKIPNEKTRKSIINTVSHLDTQPTNPKCSWQQ